MAIRNVVAPTPQPEPASRLRRTTRDVSFLRSDSRCQWYVSDLSSITLRYLGSEQKGRVSLLHLTFSSCFASSLLRRKTADTVFVVLSFSFYVWRCSPTVALSLVSTRDGMDRKNLCPWSAQHQQLLSVVRTTSAFVVHYSVRVHAAP